MELKMIFFCNWKIFSILFSHSINLVGDNWPCQKPSRRIFASIGNPGNFNASNSNGICASLHFTSLEICNNLLRNDQPCGSRVGLCICSQACCVPRSNQTPLLQPRLSQTNWKPWTPIEDKWTWKTKQIFTNNFYLFKFFFIAEIKKKQFIDWKLILAFDLI